MKLFACSCALAAAALAPAAEKKGNAEKGKAVFAQCAVCHNPNNTEKKVGPGLKGLFKREKLTSTGKKVNDANVRSRIDEGGGGMPAYRDLLSDEEKTDLIAYLKTL